MTMQAPSQQQQSRLLNLPRELRDEIYTYYLQEPGGYVHSPTSNKLRCSDDRTIDFSLMWTCKMVASEMRDLPLRVNEVVFRPFQEIKTSSEGSDVWDAWPKAGKYDFLLERLHFLQEEVFVLGASTSAPEKLTKDVSGRYPDSCIGDLLTRISKYEDEDYVPLKDIMGNPSSMTYHDREVLQACLPSLTSQADFSERLKSRSCCVDILGFGPALKLSRFRTNIPRRNRGFSILDRIMKNWWETSPHDERERQSIEQLSLLKLDHMRSTIATTLWQPWALPTEDQLVEIRDLFEDPRPETWYNFEDALPDLRYFQSATSQAIRFLDALQPQYRKQMRNIKIQEEEKSVALPECHLQGILPTCDAVPQLSVDRYVDLWRCVFPHDYGDLAYMSTSPYSEHRWTECRVSNAVPRTITWINEAVSLSLGRDTRPLVKTHFIGPFDTVHIIWNKVKSIAALYDAAMACTREERFPFPTRDDLAMAFALSNYGAYSNPELLPASVRHILSDNSLVQFPCITGTVEEFDQECQYVSTLLRDRPVEDWEQYWGGILKGDIEDGEVDFKAVQSRYADYRPRAS